MIPSIKIIFMDDWTALYVGGKLVLENHSLRTEQVLKAIGIEFQTIHLEEELEIRDQLPENYEDLEKLIKKGGQ
jgi:hypothetical protein